MNKVNQIKKNLNLQSWTPIQEDVIEAMSSHSNIVLYSPTGSGKTIAFLLPLINSIQFDNNYCEAVILSPTRELALQIEKVVKSLKLNIQLTTCYGGHSMKIERNNLEASPQLIIATPGRLHDHIRRGNVNLSKVKHFIIDEFDKSLELGFLEDIERIHRAFNNCKNYTLASATKLKEIPTFLPLKNALIIDRSSTEESQPSLSFYKYDDQDRLMSLTNLIASFQLEPTIIFCNFREDVEELYNLLSDNGIACEAYHGGLEQDMRQRALTKFRNGSSPLLICTDLGARGLDIPDIKHIIHFQLPDKEDAFIHRNGRTARMHKEGSIYIPSSELEKINYSIPELNSLKVNTSDYYSPNWHTLYFSGGKKNKINKIDLVGFLCQKGQLSKDQIGLIEVLDYTSFVAVNHDNIYDLARQLREHKIKGQKLRIAKSK